MDVSDGQRHRPGAAQLLRGLESGSGVFSAGIEDLYRWDYGTRVNCSSTRRGSEFSGTVGGTVCVPT